MLEPVLAVQLSATECGVEATPVPEVAMVDGELEASLESTTLPVTAPPMVGANWTVTVMD